MGTLIKAGADCDARDSYGRSASTPQPSAARTRPSKLLEAGASPRNADRDGRGPFWAACATRDTKIAARLLQAGADVDEQDNNGVTALRYAVAHGNADVAEFARAHGAAEVDGGRLSDVPACRGRGGPRDVHEPVAAERRRGVGKCVGRLAVVSRLESLFTRPRRTTGSRAGRDTA